MSKRKWVADRVQEAFDSVDMKSVQYLLHPMARSALEDLSAAAFLREARASMLAHEGADEVSDALYMLAENLRVRAHRVLEAMREAEERGESVGGVAVDNAPSDSGE